MAITASVIGSFGNYRFDESVQSGTCAIFSPTQS